MVKEISTRKNGKKWQLFDVTWTGRRSTAKHKTEQDGYLVDPFVLSANFSAERVGRWLAKKMIVFFFPV